MLISKHFDPVLGIDIHLLVIPPAGPVPIPHPHIALIFDVIDYVPIFGATVKVGGLPRSTAGSAGKPIPHIPMGGPFVKPPMNEDEIFMGSLTVLADGGPLSFTALPTLSCHDIGLIAPPRKKKPKKSFGMVLPTSVVIAIPLGMPVMVGGGPTIDMMGLAMMGGFAALGGAFKKLRKAQKKSKRIKKMSDAIHKRANKAMDKLGVPPNMRNKVHKGICAVTGHPVDIATGKLFTDHIDFSLPGLLPLVWERTWYSTSIYDGPLGHGWHHTYDLKLCEMDGAVAIRLADGRPVAFPALDINETCFDRQECLSLLRDSDGYILDTNDGVRYRFFPLDGDDENQLLRSVANKSDDALIHCRYNTEGQLIQLIDSGHRVIHLTYTDDGNIHKIFLPAPQDNATRDHTNPDLFCAVEYHYRHGMLVQADDALQQPLQYFYNQQLLIKERLRTGLSFYFEYDGQDQHARCTRTWGDDGIYWRELQYDTTNNITCVNNALGYVITYYHDGVLPHHIIDPMQHVSSIEYNEYSQILCNTDELGYKTRYEYDERGNTTKVINPDHTTFEMLYDQSNNIRTIIDENSNEWRYEYDDKHRLVIECDPLGNKTRYEYANGNLIRIIDPNENITALGYDQNNNLCELSQDNQITRWQFDALGKIVTMQDDRGNQRVLWRDALGRIIKTEEPDGNTRHIEYDAFDNIIYLKDRQYEIFMAYQGMGKLSSRQQNGTTVSFEYNKEEQLVAITNEHSRTYQFTLNANGDVIHEVAFDGKTREYLRDPVGQVIRVNRFNNRHTTFLYDPMGRATQVIYSDGTKELFEFRANGELIKASNDACVVRFERDPLGRVTKECLNEHWVASEYNSTGSRISVKSSLGFHQTINRNKLGDVTALTANQLFETKFKRDNWGLELQRDLPGGIQSRWGRDRLGRPIHHEVIHEKSHGHQKRYQWGINDRLFKTINAAQRETTFNHDETGHLISANYDNGTFDIRMPDSVGNLFKTTHRKDRTYGLAGELLTATTPAGAVRYEYDTDGNLCRKIERDTVQWCYEWFLNGLLKKVIRPDGLQVTFEYDPLGRRISKTFNNKITRWVWDGDNPLHEWKHVIKIANPQTEPLPAKALSDQAGIHHRQSILQPIEPQGPPEQAVENQEELSPIKTWLFEPDSVTPMGILVDDKCYSIITDHLGTPSQVYDQYGEQVWAADISIWGELHNLQGESGFCPFRWPGQYEDQETGLYYNRYRYYDPAAGLYISQDPVRLEGGLDLYKYVTDPNTWVDIFGLNVSTGRGRDHVTYRGTKGGKPYTGYASAPSSLGLSPDEIVSYRYKGDFSPFGGRAPTVVYSGSGAPGKHTARGLEQHYYEEDVKKHGKKNVANKQNPVGETNKRRKKYIAAKNKHLKGGCT